MEGCTECNWELGPPPDSIMAIPPPPMPAFLHLAPTNITTPPCNILCDWNTGQGVEFIELPRQGPLMDNTWLMVLVSFCVGVLLLGSLLALILLKFRTDEGGKVKSTSSDGGKSCEAVLYPMAADGRAIWATLTPRGTTTTVAPLNSFDNSAYLDPEETLKPRVSCPTRIEHPNLPPLNLHRSLRRNKENNNPPIV